MLDHLETTFISAYIEAIKRRSALGHRELTVLVAPAMAVEYHHRALSRVIVCDDPADNVTLEVAEFSCVGDVAPLLKPFLTGRDSLAAPRAPFVCQARSRRRARSDQTSACSDPTLVVNHNDQAVSTQAGNAFCALGLLT